MAMGSNDPMGVRCAEGRGGEAAVPRGQAPGGRRKAGMFVRGGIVVVGSRMVRDLARLTRSEDSSSPSDPTVGPMIRARHVRSSGGGLTGEVPLGTI